ncbi:MAG: glucokinase [Ignavibacteria bacterium]|nr:glucokinase [Ignavibacteria bacterium]
MILAGDVGGTKINLAFVEPSVRTLEIRGSETYRTRDFSSFEEVIAAFVGSLPHRVTAASFGVPGPVVNGVVRTTNLRWTIDSAVVAKQLGIPSVGLINDLQATAYGVLRMKPEDIRFLNKGAPREHGTIGVIAAGTGLGEGALVWTGTEYRALASEGGHTDFGPRNEMEIELLRFLGAEFGRVSYERLVSGPGLRNLYRFFRTRSGNPEPPWLTEAFAAGDPSAAIVEAALAGTDHVCRESLDEFVSVYGAETGNLALKVLATGGMYIGGGIAPRIAAELQTPRFLEACMEKGRYRDLLTQIPVAVILNDKAALFGAAHYALMNPDRNSRT